MKLSVIVPCFNEVDNVTKISNELVPVVESLLIQNSNDASQKFDSIEIVFVDDGSRDGTHTRLIESFENNQVGLSYKILKHEINMGLGAAIRTGFANADGDILLTVDSDGTYKFTEIPALLSLLTPSVDIVTASPYHPQGGVVGVPAYRLILSRGSSFIYRLLVDWKIYTYTCLFRAYRVKVIKNTPFKSNGFLAGTEILVNAILNGYKVIEFPAVLHKRMYGVSKAKIAQTIFSHLKFQGWVLLHRFRALFGSIPGQKTRG